MSIDLAAVLKDFGGQISGKIVENIRNAAEQLSSRDLEIIGRAGRRKAELLFARMLGQDVTEDEKQVDTTLGFLASKAAAIAKETVKKTALEVVKTAAGVVLKLVFGAIVP